MTTNIKFIYILSLSWATKGSDVRMELLIPCLGRTGNAQTQDQAQLYVSTFLILFLSFPLLFLLPFLLLLALQCSSRVRSALRSWRSGSLLLLLLLLWLLTGDTKRVKTSSPYVAQVCRDERDCVCVFYIS